MDMSNEDSTCFVGICKLVSPLYIKDISITDKTPGTIVSLNFKINFFEGEFGVRLSLEGKFVYVDAKSSSSLGYSSLELLGKSYFEYIHVDDLDKIEDSFGKCKFHRIDCLKLFSSKSVRRDSSTNVSTND